ncbi:efflux RND transporter periplasmic adaptor subunit [Vibrio chagasii]|nr:efflux RND transporter periplasmic adaptor subunit [Vibrio chagasii]
MLETTSALISTGSNAEMTLDATCKKWQGTATTYLILDPKTRTLRVRLKFSSNLAGVASQICLQYCAETHQ